MEITRAIAEKVLGVVDAGLSNGMGEPIPGQMCVEAAVCYALGLPHGDDPQCVAPSLRRLKIRINDSRWTSNEARAKGLRRLAIAQLGSAGHLDEAEFVRRVAKLAMSQRVPKALRAVAGLFRDGTATKERLLNAADICERDEPNQQTAKKLRDLAWDIRNAAAAAAADAAAAAAAAAVAAAAADAAAVAAAVAVAVADAVAVAVAAADAAAAAAADAVAAADADADADAAAAAAADAVAAARKKFWETYWKIREKGSDKGDAALAEFAEGVVQILIDLKAPGCQWLELTELSA